MTVIQTETAGKQHAIVLDGFSMICALAPIAAAADPLDEMRRTFTVGGKPIPPQIFADFGDADLAERKLHFAVRMRRSRSAA